MDHLRPLPSDPPAPGAEQASPTPDLAELLARAAQGDQAAFAEFYDATSARAYSLALRVLRNPSHAQEVTQEAYLLVWRQGARFDPARGSAMAWLMTIVHRTAVDRVRATEGAARRDRQWDESTRTVAHDETAETAEAAVEGDRVRRAVAALTPAQRQAIELAYFGGHTYTEVATMLEVPVGTAKTRIRDGLIRLRDALGVAR